MIWIFDNLFCCCYIGNIIIKKYMKINHKNQIYPVILEQDVTGGYIVTNPAFDGCYSQGETVEEALKNIREATELCLEESKKPTVKNISLHLINLNAKYA
jgi:predicted RNase H-like HicB family nuclease